MCMCSLKHRLNVGNEVFLSGGGCTQTHTGLWLSWCWPLQCWICIWIQLWAAGFMPLWLVPNRAFFSRLSPSILFLIFPNCDGLLIGPRFSSSLFLTDSLLFISCLPRQEPYLIWLSPFERLRREVSGCPSYFYGCNAYWAAEMLIHVQQ